MMKNIFKEQADDFISMFWAETGQFKTFQAILFYGSFTRMDPDKDYPVAPFNDIDIIPVLTGRFENNDKLIDASAAERTRFEYLISHAHLWNLPPVHISGYFGILQKLPDSDYSLFKRNIGDEISQLEKQVRTFYDHHAALNSLDSSTRNEYGISKPSRDFRFSFEHSIFQDRTLNFIMDTMFKRGVETLLLQVNAEFEGKVKNYSIPKAENIVE